MLKNFKKILKIVIDMLTLFVFLILLLIIVSKVKMIFSGKNYFDFFGYSVFNVATGSMEPTLKQNDIILVKKCDDYVVDDIVTFESDGAYITHRIITKRGNDIVTKGDANNTKDVGITIDSVIGKVIKIYHNAGIWQKVMTTPQIIIMVFVTLILFDFAFSYKGFKNKKNVKIVDKIKDVDLKEVNKKEDSPNMSDGEIVELGKKVDLVQKGEEVNFDKKEKEFLNYTIRLDLNELQKEIANKIRKEKND